MTDKKKPKSKLDKTMLVCRIVFWISFTVSVLSLIVSAGGAA